MRTPLRVVVFTAGPLSPVNRAFYERLASDPVLELGAIVVDDYRRRRQPLARRVLRGLREGGPAWLWFKLSTRLQASLTRVAVAAFERAHPSVSADETHEELGRRLGVPVHHVPDIHSDDSLALIRGLRPQVGAIVGGRILRDSVTSIPELGTLNVHKRKVPDYRGGGPVGYWEVLAGEREIGVTIHYATSRVDEGPVLAEAAIPIEECDTLESLRIKADLTGARLYQQALRSIAAGERTGRAQDAGRGKTFRAPSDYRVWRLERELRKRAAASMPSLRERDALPARLRALAQYALLLPWLVRLRGRLAGEGRAPVCILFYHLVANRPLNHMALPLEEFARQVDFLRRYYGIVPLEEAAARASGAANDRLVAALTFDDGYRDNTWALEYLRFFGVPAAFFVSIGHVEDGSPFEHDTRRGYHQALPMTQEDVRRLAADGFLVGSHGVHHEDLGSCDEASVEGILCGSRDRIAAVTGAAPSHFSFPKGKRGLNITEAGISLALRHYTWVYSAYGGYNFPEPGRRHFLRVGNPTGLAELAAVMDGYTGARQCVAGNAWGLKTAALQPY